MGPCHTVLFPPTDHGSLDELLPDPWMSRGLIINIYLPLDREAVLNKVNLWFFLLRDEYNNPYP